ncbi:murein hydrolase activator EnvC family protein [Roseobacter sp. HKCCA0434]|uniref:murein hydrolase activator EnvC family protein n=1 Tax=Roseobacter sp. HKCCA0434 TaxID=3079297 RepID=UPI002905DD3C|nr:peptidoglycan DD-metalloendopeptidase family protein [Roseobacter sp. HKCCA0434]
MLTLWALPLTAQVDAVGRTERAAALIAEAGERFADLPRGADRLAALAEVVQGYEIGLVAQREVERDLARRAGVLRAEVERENARIARLLAGLQRAALAPAPLLMLHPQGPEGAARASQVMAGLVPRLQAEAEGVRTLMAELDALAREQARSAESLRDGLAGVEAARAELHAALDGRTLTPPPDPALVARLRADATSLQDFARMLARQGGGSGQDEGFADQRGRLPLPAPGRVVRAFGEAGGDGIVRPGIVLAVDGVRQVIAPAAGTLRYGGAFLDYGHIVVLEPENGWLMVIGGLDEVQRAAGEVLLAGEPVGTLTQTRSGPAGFGLEPQGETGTNRQRTIYVELRRNGVPVDPAPWFTMQPEQGLGSE